MQFGTEEIELITTLSPALGIIYLLVKFVLPQIKEIIQIFSGKELIQIKEKEKYNAQQIANNAKLNEERLDNLRKEIEEISQELSEVKEENKKLSQELEEKSSLIFKLQAENEVLNTHLAIFEEIIASMEKTLDEGKDFPISDGIAKVIQILKKEDNFKQ